MRASKAGRGDGCLDFSCSCDFEAAVATFTRLAAPHVTERDSDGGCTMIDKYLQYVACQ